jgi:hypothetical protein
MQVVIGASIMFFKTAASSANIAGTVVALTGVLLYSLAKRSAPAAMNFEAVRPLFLLNLRCNVLNCSPSPFLMFIRGMYALERFLLACSHECSFQFLVWVLLALASEIYEKCSHLINHLILTIASVLLWSGFKVDLK